jgi:predicted nucleotidyltransferase
VISRADVLARVQPLLDREPAVVWAYLFGSCAREGRGRDVDLAIMTTSGALPTAVAFGQLVARLEAAAGCKVDLVDLRTAPLPLAGALLRDRIVVVDRDREARHQWEADTTSRWLDFAPAYERSAQVRREAMLARANGKR